MTYPLVRDLAADGIPVTVTCRVLGFSTQGFYKWRANPVSARDWDDAQLINAIVDIHADDPEFGYRFIADELREAGHVCSENRVARLCSLQQIASSILRKRRGNAKRPGPPVHDDHVNRDFHADGLDEIWLTDITEHPTGEGKLYICAVKDVCSRRIVGYAIDARMTSQLADAALRTAIARRRPTGTLVVHSDRGGQFRSRCYQRTLRAHGLTGSMGRVSAAGDNAAMESFFSLLQKNVLNRQKTAATTGCDQPCTGTRRTSIDGVVCASMRKYPQLGSQFSSRGGWTRSALNRRRPSLRTSPTQLGGYGADAPLG